MTAFLDESQVAITTVGFLREFGYGYAPGPRIAPDERSAEWGCSADVLLQGRLREAVARLNPAILPDTRDDAARKVLAEDLLLQESQTIIGVEAS